ncbi:MAG: hypothetical protein EVG15_08090 [Candidatus Acididesulfobacter diazotrophicus]|jgi:hypothetical protein|uniref:L,D-TPase catalytic domain-containing protein n=1 Tax=Candidatus Acididesulfobacter diazotrophicus TaxID=2597226 RepID=A0A519BL67_9DELT|nr:MAG: hypothetical protein EVG15_08090 [Candidatus Acididesulfobacter diazotrophicus]
MNKQKNIKKKLSLIIFILIIFFLTGSSIAFMVNKPLRYTFKNTVFVPLKNFTLSIFNIKSANSLLVNVSNNNVKYKSANIKKIKLSINHIQSVKKNKRKLKIIIPSNFTYPYLYHGIYRTGNNLFSVIMSKLGYLPIECVPFNVAAYNKNYIYIKYEHNKYCRWRWKWKNLPENFIKDWKPDYFSSMLEGAAMNFQYQNGLKITGRINENVWKTAFKDLKINKKNKYGITYVWANKNFPKTLHLWKNGKNILVSFVNTGVFNASTNNGIFPVYQRYFEATMSGKTPWNKSYDDKHIPFINYFNYYGEAIHGFPRGMYGINRSLGCLELPLRNAWIVWKKINFGTMVDVIKDADREPAFKQKNYLHPKIKNFIPNANFLKYYLINKAKKKKTKKKIFALKVISNKVISNKVISYNTNKVISDKVISNNLNVPLKLKFIYVDYGMSFKGIPVTSLVYFKFIASKDNDGYKFHKKILLTSGINYGGKIGLISKTSDKNNLFFTDVRNLKGTYIRSIYSLSKLSVNFSKINIKRRFTVKQRNSGILSNIAIDKKNDTLWVILYLYSYSKNRFNNYLCKIAMNPPSSMPFTIQRKILLKNYVSYLTFDKNGNLWLSGLKFKNGKVINYIEKIKGKYLNKNFINHDIKQLYTIPGKFSSTMPIIPENKNNLLILKHSYRNGNVYNDIIKIKQNYLKHKYVNTSIKNIASIKGYVGNLSENSQGDLFFIDNILKRGIFYKTLYEIDPYSNSYKPVKLLKFNGKLNGVASSLVFLN